MLVKHLQTNSFQNRKLELIKINKRFDDTYAVHDVSLHVGDGEFVSIVGPSGCGKSTLLNMISGLVEPDRGEIIIEGNSEGKRLGRSSYMYQKDLLLPWAKIIDNVSLSLRLKGMGKKAARNEVKDLFEIFGLDEFMFKYPFQLSGGMRQRAALMRTYVDGKSLLLLDEPFGGLDAITKAKMQDWLLEVQRELKATILFITHDIEEAIYLSDRVYIMTDRPSEIKEEIEVDLPRPRNRHMIQDERFTSLKEYLLEKFL